MEATPTDGAESAEPRHPRSLDLSLPDDDKNVELDGPAALNVAEMFREAASSYRFRASLGGAFAEDRDEMLRRADAAREIHAWLTGESAHDGSPPRPNAALDRIEAGS